MLDINKLVPIEEEKRKHTRKTIIETIQTFSTENRRLPTAKDFDNNKNYPSSTTIQRIFGKWNNAIIEAGFNPNRRYTKQKLIDIIQQFATENGRQPTIEDFTNDPKYPCLNTYRNKFGSWLNSLIASGFKPHDNDILTRGREGELQTLSEFKTEGAVDLSGQCRGSSCDGICPKGGKFDTKSASLTRQHGSLGWKFGVSISQLEEADYLFLRAYKDKDFTKSPEHKWRIPIEFMDNKTIIFIHKEDMGMYNVKNMKKYEI